MPRIVVPRPRLKTYLRLVGATGCAALAATLALGDCRLGLGFATVSLVGLLVVGENTPVRVPGNDDEVTTSSAVALALLALFGPGAAVAAQALGSAVADVRLRKPPRTVCFNAGQYVLALLAAAAVLSASDAFPLGLGNGPLTAGALGRLALAGITYHVVNNVLAGTASALSLRRPVLAHLRSDVVFQAWSAGLVLAFTPVVVAVARADALLVPFLLVPLLALNRAGEGAREADRQALYDGLTGLASRALFRIRGRTAIAAAEAADACAGVLVMDLDRFKEINDTLGHHHGDLLLQEVAARLTGSLDAGATVARFGGDEFAVLLGDLPDAATGEAVARRVLECLREPLAVRDVTLRVDASIGIACAPHHGTDVDTLLKHADVAMYAAKEARSGVALYMPGRDSNSLERLALASDLRDGLERHEFVLHFQPQVDLATGGLIGAEALMRWNHPKRGLVAPGAFIALAEKTGAIQALTSIALRMAVEQAAAWRAAGRAVPVAVNVSAQDVLGPHLVEELAALLAEYDVPADGLKLELTESMLLVDPERAQEVLDAVSSMGVRIAIDDFGTGYSSLAYLTRLPIDELKIDRSFVARLHEPDSAVIVGSTIELARRLGMRTVAEGVEDAGMLDVLVANHCDAVQGFYFSRPLEAAAFEAWADERGSSPELATAA